MELVVYSNYKGEATLKAQYKNYCLIEIENDKYRGFEKYRANISVEEFEKLYKNEKTKELTIKLNRVCDKKTKEAKNLIAGKIVTDEQLQRYRDKYLMAKRYKEEGSYEDELKLEASFRKMKVEELADAIISAGDNWEKRMLSYSAKIEGIKTGVNLYIKNEEFNKANEIINEVDNIKIDTSIKEIKALFK